MNYIFRIPGHTSDVLDTFLPETKAEFGVTGEPPLVWLLWGDSQLLGMVGGTPEPWRTWKTSESPRF